MKIIKFKRNTQEQLFILLVKIFKKKLLIKQSPIILILLAS